MLPFAIWLQKGHMKRLGIERTMRVARAHNRLKFGRNDANRRRLYEQEFEALMRENGATVAPPLEMKDGWAIDTSQTLPHLKDVLADTRAIIAERAGTGTKRPLEYRSFFNEIQIPEDFERCPSFLNFATSSDMIQIVANYLKCIPCLSRALPHGVRFVESRMIYDEDAVGSRDSQLFHIDYYAKPAVYVILLLEDVNEKRGPFRFFPKSKSQEAAAKLGYWKKGAPYRLTDEQVFSILDAKDLIDFSYPRGSVLFIEASGCLHYGSRKCVESRFQMMLGFHTALRTDFAEFEARRWTYHTQPGDSRLRKMVIDKFYRG